MDAHKVRLVQESFARAATVSDAVATNFYQRLFRRAPQVRGLFPANMTAQRLKLIETLATIIEAVDKPERLTALATALGRSHQGYGARPEHYAPVGEALIATLRDHLGPSWTPDTEDAWREAYGAIAALMQQGQRELA